eukprot:9862896-Prorocentrum_lima.AAC.1
MQLLAWTRPTFYTQVFPDARLADGWVLKAWYMSTCIAVCGLLSYRQFHSPIEEHPLLQGAAGDGNTLQLARLAKVLGSRSTPALSDTVARSVC